MDKLLEAVKKLQDDMAAYNTHSDKRLEEVEARQLSILKREPSTGKDVTKAPSSLHYGDIIYLSTSGGSVGTFYSFTNLNNVLLLQRGSGVQAAQAMWCLFRVVPPYACIDQETLMEENSKIQKNWEKIHELEKDVTQEKLDNKKRFVRSLTRAVRYHQQIQLQHVSSGKFLSHTGDIYSRTFSIEEQTIPCCLEDIPSDTTKFRVDPAIPGYISSDMIHEGDIISLFTNLNRFVKYSVPKDNIPGPAKFTVSIFEKILGAPEVKDISRDEEDLEDLLNPKHLIGTNIIQLLKCGTNKYYVYDENGEESKLAIKNFPKKEGRHYCAALETYWIVEHIGDNGSLNGRIVDKTCWMQLKSFISGKYVKFPKEIVRFESTLAREDNCKYRTGAHVKLATDNGYIGHEDDTVVVKENFDYSDTLTLREVESMGIVAATKLQGLGILLRKLLASDIQTDPEKHYTVLTTILEESVNLLDTNGILVENFTELGIIDDLLELVKRYNNANNVMCMNVICKIFNKITSTGKMMGYDIQFKELVSDLIAGSLTFSAINGEDEGENNLIVSTVHSLIDENSWLVTRIPTITVDKLLDKLAKTYDPIEKREIIRILCRLCRCNQNTISINQVTVTKFLFKDTLMHPTLLKHVYDNNDVFYNEVSITTIDQKSELYLDLINQLELLECLLFGRHTNDELGDLVQEKNMFTLSECVYVIKENGIDQSIKSWYIQILIAAHIGTGVRETGIISDMLTFQYEQNVTNRTETADPADKPPPHDTDISTKKLYKDLQYELEDFMKNNKTFTVLHGHEQNNSNVYYYDMVCLLESMIRAGRIEDKDTSQFITPLINFLDGTRDEYSNTDLNSESKGSFQNIFRFKSSELNQPIFKIKNRALQTLYYIYEKSLFRYWTEIMRNIYTTVKHYDTNKDKWLTQITDFLGQLDFKETLREVIINIVENEDFDIMSPDELESRETLISKLLVDEYKRIELFDQTERLVSVLMDTMRYEDSGLSEHSLKLLVMIRSPTNRLLELLPKSNITLSKTEFDERKKIVTCVTEFKISKHELSSQSREKICETLDTLEQSLNDKEAGMTKDRQKLLFDLDSVSEVIMLLCEPIMPTSKDEVAAKSIDMLKAKGFSLLRHLITGLPAAQSIVMKHFKELISVKGISGESSESSELEVARVLALNEVFTANTNLCITVSDDILQVIFDKLVSLVKVSSNDKLSLSLTPAYRYFELLENIIDLEESDIVLYKFQALILRFMDEYWEILNGTVSGSETSLNLLKCSNLHDMNKDNQDSRVLYIVKALSLLSCCTLDSVDSSALPICKKLIPYDELKYLMLLNSSSAISVSSVIYFNVVSKFFLNVYLKKCGAMKKNERISDAMEFIRWFGTVLLKTLGLELGDPSTSLNTLQLNDLFNIHDTDDIAFFNSREGEHFTRFELLILDCILHDHLLPLITELDECGEVLQLQCKWYTLLHETTNVRSDKFIKRLSSIKDLVNKHNLPFQRGEDLEGERNEVKQKVDDVSTASSETASEAKLLPQGERSEVKEKVDDVLTASSESKEMVECSKINEMFQNVVSVVHKVIKSDVTDLFFTKSDELCILGMNILGTCNLENPEGVIGQTVNMVYTAPGATKDFVLQQIKDGTQKSIPLPTYEEEELWMLLKRVFGWLKEDHLSDRFIVKQLLNSITLQIETLMPDEDKQPVLMTITSKLLEANCVEMLCSLINRDTSAQPAITCLSSFLQFPGVQTRMLQVCRSSENTVFEWIWEQIKTARAAYEQFNVATNANVGNHSHPTIDIDTATPHMRLSIQFLGRLSNKMLKLQDYLRWQDNKILSHNFLEALLNLLKTVPMNDVLHNSRRREHCNMIVDILVTLVDMLSTNTGAKEYAIELGIIESIDRLLVKNNNNTELEDKLKIRINCYQVLITLLEYDNKLLDVGEKIIDALDIDDLHKSVSEHLEVLDNPPKDGQNVRDSSFMAIIKGYKVIKKLSRLDGFVAKYTGKSIDDIIKDITGTEVQIDSVEVIWNNSLEKVYFPITADNYIRYKVQDEMLWRLARKNLNDKNKDFLSWSKEILADMEQVAWLRSGNSIISKLLIKLEFFWDWCVVLLALAIQVWLLLEMKDYGMSDPDVKCGKTENYTYLMALRYTSSGGNETTQQVCVSKVYSKVSTLLGLLQLFSTLLLTATYVVTNFHRFEAPTYNLGSWITGNKEHRSHSKLKNIRRMAISITSFYHLWLVIMIICSALGIVYYGVFFCVHLLHIIAMFDLLTRVIKGATANRDQLLVVFPFALCIILIYAMVHFHVTRSTFNNSSMEYCDSVWQCFSTAIRYSFRNSNGGHNFSWTDKKSFNDQWIRIAMDVTFWMLYSIIGLKVVTALILDGFITQKKDREFALTDMHSMCTICGITKDEFASKGIDWDEHIKEEHNIWSYIKLFYYLNDNKNKSSKLSALESEVLEKFNRSDADISFLPRKKSLSLKRAIKEADKRGNKIIKSF